MIKEAVDGVSQFARLGSVRKIKGKIVDFLSKHYERVIFVCGSVKEFEMMRRTNAVPQLFQVTSSRFMFRQSRPEPFASRFSTNSFGLERKHAYQQ